jgi:hypothetical protein
MCRYKRLAVILTFAVLSGCGSSSKNSQSGASASPIGDWVISVTQSAPNGVPLGTVTASTSTLSLGMCATYLQSISTVSGLCGSASSPGALSVAGAGTLQPALFVVGVNSQTIANGETVYLVLVENNPVPYGTNWFLGGTGIYKQADSEIVGTLSCQIPESFGNPTNRADCAAWQNVPFSALYSSSN